MASQIQTSASGPNINNVPSFNNEDFKDQYDKIVSFNVMASTALSKNGSAANTLMAPTFNHGPKNDARHRLELEIKKINETEESS